jgi:hypothetical protein
MEEESNRPKSSFNKALIFVMWVDNAELMTPFAAE